MFLVGEKDLLLKEFGLLTSNHFCWRKLSQQETQFEPEKTHLLMHKKVVLVGFRRWMKMNYLGLFKGSPKNSVRLIQCPLNFWKIIQEWFFFCNKNSQPDYFEEIVSKFWESAQITPLLKKPSFDHNVASSYRPFSDLPVLFKLSERFFSTE